MSDRERFTAEPRYGYPSGSGHGHPVGNDPNSSNQRPTYPQKQAEEFNAASNASQGGYSFHPGQSGGGRGGGRGGDRGGDRSSAGRGSERYSRANQQDRPNASSAPSNVSGKAPTFAKVANPFYDAKIGTSPSAPPPSPLQPSLAPLTHPTAAQFGGGEEVDPHRLEQRTKQVQFGKNTIGYDHYTATVPKAKRLHPAMHPRTPNVHEDISKRAFDGKIKAWRRALHLWDNPDYRPISAAQSNRDRDRDRAPQASTKTSSSGKRKAEDECTETDEPASKRRATGHQLGQVGGAEGYESPDEKQELAELAEDTYVEEEGDLDEDVL